MATNQSGDAQLQLLISDFFELEGLSLRDDDSGEELILRYLRANATLIILAIQNWMAASERELGDLLANHHELDPTAASHGWKDVGTEAIAIALGESPLTDIDEDDLRTLRRILQYASYLTDSELTGERVEMSPVINHLGAPVAPSEEVSHTAITAARLDLEAVIGR